jgi:hypothetical protein
MPIVTLDINGNIKRSATFANPKNYKVYSVRLDQSGTNAPVATILENTLSGIPVWSRWSAGCYELTLAGEWVADHVAIFVSGGEPIDHLPYLFVVDRNNVNTLYLFVFSDFGSQADAWYAYVEVRVYA